jgi:polar amino acid transport system substrate-binding protein
MGRSFTWLVLALAVLWVPLSNATAREQIRVASENWKYYTQPDGQGLVWDILRLVYQPVGVDLIIQSVPHTRAAGLARRGEVDAFAGSYRYEVGQGIFYPEKHYDIDVVSAMGLRGSVIPTLKTLQEFRLAWRHGYEFQRYLPISKNYRQVSENSNVLSMLEQHRADYYLDDLSELEHILEQVPDRAQYQVTPLVDLPVYLGFTDNPRGKQLAELFDERMKVLLANGSLRPVFHLWKQRYPFD